METLQRRARQDLAAYERVEAVLAAEAARLDHLLQGLEAELAEVDGGKDPRRGGSPADPEDRMVLASLVAHCRTDAADICQRPRRSPHWRP